MDNAFIMAIDLGTSFIKAGLYDLRGNCYAMEQSPIKSDSSRSGIFLQNGEDIYASVLSCMKGIAEASKAQCGKIAAIGFTGQMAGVMGVDGNWNDVTSWSCSLDTRYTPYAEKQIAALQKEFLEIGGTNGPLMAPKCEWFIHEFPEKARRVVKYMPISSYITGKLGALPIEEAKVGVSYLTWTGLADIRNNTWSEYLCKKAGISSALLPKAVGPSSICGYLSAEAASETGLKSGIPLVSGAGDKVAGNIGAGVLSAGNWIFEASSYGAISCLVKDFRPDLTEMDYDAVPALNPNEFYIHQFLPGSGITLKWFLDTFTESGKKDPFSEIEKKAAELPCGSEGLMAVGLFGGSAMPFDGELKGTWSGITWNHRKEHFYRALLESFAYELSYTIESMKKMYPEYANHTRIKLIGGGAGSKIWPKILADATGCEFVTLNRNDVAMLGTSFLSAKAAGLIDEISVLSESIVEEKESFYPDWDNHEIYGKYRTVYRELKKATRESCRKLYHMS